jgi:hypothetical protein
MLMFTGDGHLSYVAIRSDLTSIAANNRNEGTADENKAIVQGSLAEFGTYKVDAANKVTSFHITGSTYANSKGSDQARPYTLVGDRLTWTVGTMIGGKVTVVLKRLQ